MPNITISNQKPAVLECNHYVPAKGSFDISTTIKEMIAEPLFEPIGNAPVSIAVDGNDIDVDEFTQYVITTLDEAYDDEAEQLVKGVFERGLIHYNPTSTLLARKVFTVQAGCRAKLPIPTASIIYTPEQDVIPAAKGLLANQTSFDMWFASLAFYAKPVTLGVSLTNEDTFNRFKEWVANEVNTVRAALPAETIRRFDSFNKDTDLKGLTESIAIRKDYNDDNDELSFSRMLAVYIVQYSTIDPDNFGILPFDVSELVCPRSVIFVNVDAHAHATKKQVAQEWTIINKSIAAPIHVISSGKISKLTTAQRTVTKMQASAAQVALSSQRKQGATKHANTPFRKTPPTATDLLKLVKKVLQQMSNVARSENVYKEVKSSFARTNRRHPDDYNLPGKVISTKYKPDLHIYLDTSGSITERNYEDMIKACIRLARKLDINLYFNSFSHVMSQCTYLPVKGRSTKQIYRQFQKIPKVGGGTNYVQIWEYINASKKRRRELSIIMTDMEYSTPSHLSVPHPKNLYYVPCSHMDWDYLVRCAQMFVNSSRHVAPDIRKHVLM